MLRIDFCDRLAIAGQLGQIRLRDGPDTVWGTRIRLEIHHQNPFRPHHQTVDSAKPQRGRDLRQIQRERDLCNRTRTEDLPGKRRIQNRQGLLHRPPKDLPVQIRKNLVQQALTQIRPIRLRNIRQPLEQ